MRPALDKKKMDLQEQQIRRRDRALAMTRRHLFGRTAAGIGVAALAQLLAQDGLQAAPGNAADPLASLGQLPQLHFAPRARRVIYLHQSGGPSHIDLFDHKPELTRNHGVELPDSVRMGQRITGMTSGQKSFPCVQSVFKFSQHGPAGAWISELLPHTASIADQLCIIKSMHTEAINHDPAITFIQTGAQQPGRPSLGSWLSYGIGSENENMPAFMVLISLASNGQNDQPLFGRLWGSGFLPSVHQGVKLRSTGDPVLYLSNPPGIDAAGRRKLLDSLSGLNELARKEYGDPEIETRVRQYEMAYRMQTSVPDLMNLKDETEATFEMYGPESRKPGSYAANCLLARRMIERGVRFVQLYHRGWDQHGNLPKNIRSQCSDTDQPSAALVRDLKQRGLLDETLVVWGGEFGRTVYSQGALTADNYGRDHHGRCYSMWLAGGGMKPGVVHGETDDFCYNIVRDPVHVHDLNATLLHCLGIDHTRLTYRYQGRDFRLTDVEGVVVKNILR